MPEAHGDVRDLGRHVSPTPSPTPSNHISLQGSYVTLEGLSYAHIPSLWRNLGLPKNNWLFDYLPFPYPDSQTELWSFLERTGTERGFIFYAIKANLNYLNPPGNEQSLQSDHKNRDEVVGVIAYLNVSPQNRELEVGAVVFGPALQRSTAATEAHYLLLRNVCEPDVSGISPPYCRISWKYNSLNSKSRRAAERLGYQYEGTFRKHMIVKGRSRDSDWLSIIDDEWPVVKAALEAWLDGSNFDEHGKQVRSLDAIRAALMHYGG